MPRVINPDGVGKERKRLTRAVVIAIRELMQQEEQGENVLDPAAFIALALDLIEKTIDTTVAPWEKRDYWLKADKFRLEWEWTSKSAEDMKTAVIAKDFAGIAQAAAIVGQKLYKVDVSKRHRMGTPWVGAWKKFSANNK